MYYSSEINEGKDLTKNISRSSGCRRADGRERFAYDLHEMLRVGGPGWEGEKMICGLKCGGLL